MPRPDQPPREVRGRWISAASAERNLGLLRRSELAQLRRFGTVHYADAGTVVAASGSRVTHVQVVSDGELELRARLDEGRATMAVVRTGGVITTTGAVAAGLSEQETIAVRRGEAGDAKTAALVTLVREQAANVGQVKDNSWQAALDAGWSDAELAESSAVVALNLFTNYWNHFVETELDLPAAPAM